MPKKRAPRSAGAVQKTTGYIEGAGEIVEQPIVSTLEENYMPYAMSVIHFPRHSGNRRI